MLILAKSYNSEKLNWNWTSDLIADEAEIIERLIIHSYDADISEKYQQKFNQTKSPITRALKSNFINNKMSHSNIIYDRWSSNIKQEIHSRLGIKYNKSFIPASNHTAIQHGPV